MITIKSKYLGHLRTESIHVQSGQKIITDAPTDNQGKGEYFSPTDLLATSYASCIITIMGIMAEKENINIVGTEVNITKIMATKVRKVEELVVEFNFPDRKYSEHEKDIIEKLAGTSPVPLSVHADMKQTIIFNWK